MAKKREGVICQGTNALFSPNGYARKYLQRGEKVSIFEEEGDYFKIGVNLYVPKFNVIPIIQPEAKTGKVIEYTVVEGTVLEKDVTVGVYGEVDGMYKVRYNRQTLYIPKNRLEVN
jgi:hypothetical protein